MIQFTFQNVKILFEVIPLLRPQLVLYTSIWKDMKEFITLIKFFHFLQNTGI